MHKMKDSFMIHDVLLYCDLFVITASKCLHYMMGVFRGFMGSNPQINFRHFFYIPLYAQYKKLNFCNHIQWKLWNCFLASLLLTSGRYGSLSHPFFVAGFFSLLCCNLVLLWPYISTVQYNSFVVVDPCFWNRLFSLCSNLWHEHLGLQSLPLFH